jgi:predicted ATPase
MITDIRFIKRYDLRVEKESQRRFPVKTIKPTTDSGYRREKYPYDMFTLFSKGLRINFIQGVNVIVGENGSGKSTLISLIKNNIKYDDNDYTYIEVNGNVTNENTIFFDGEKDNPLTAIPQMINPMDSKNFVSLSAQLFFASEESHGESMLPALDYILDNAHGGYTIFMDEPETALSLGNQIRLVKKMWKSAEKGNQLIISTHSLAIINCFNTIFDMETRKWVDREKYVKNILDT